MRLEQLKSLLEEDPSSSFLHFAIAKEYEKLDLNEDAIKKYQYLLDTDPNYTGLYYHYAKLLEEIEEIQAALDMYDRGILICKSQSDQHSLSELQNAKMNLEIS